SGSFVLILMGNYELVFIKAVNDMDLKILSPVILGAGFGLLAFSHLLSWIFKRFRNITISLLTGFILGSLSILWPWKKYIYYTDELGNLVLKNTGEPVIEGYKRILPDTISTEVVFAVCFMLAGIISIWLIEKVAEKSEKNPE
ncbi:MAG: DUF368 domain-containing protein, partial [Bacteroidales bacterium]